MTNTVPISNLPVATFINNADVFPIVQSGVTKQVAYSIVNADVSSIAALRLMTPEANKGVVVSKYYETENTGGGGIYYGVTSDGPYTDNGGSIITPGGVAGSSTAWILNTKGAYSVRQFGAKGDGVTDDATAINNTVQAMSAAGGGTVYIPAGTYLLGTTNVNNANYAYYIQARDNVSIVGDGIDVTILKVKSGENSRFAAYNSPNIIAANQATPLKDCRFMDFTLDWNGANNLLTSLMTARNNATIYSGRSGINILVQRIKVKETPGNQCILLSASSNQAQNNIVIRDCVFTDSGSGLTGNYNADHSSIYCNGDNLLYDNNIFTATNLVVGSCFEIHGSYSTARNNYSYNYNRATWLAANYEGITDILLDGNKHYGVVMAIDFSQTTAVPALFINNIDVVNCVYSQRSYSAPNSAIFFINNEPVAAYKLRNCNSMHIVNCEFLGYGNYPAAQMSFMNADFISNLIMENNRITNFLTIGINLSGANLGDGYVIKDYNLQNNIFYNVANPFYCLATLASGGGANLNAKSLMIQNNTFEYPTAFAYPAITFYAVAATGQFSNNNVINFNALFAGNNSGVLSLPTLQQKQGTFTPVVSGRTSAGSGTYSAQYGQYIKNGKFVTFELYVAWTAHTGTGGFSVTLPFTPTAYNVGPIALSIIAENVTVTAGKQVSAIASAATNDIVVYESAPGGTLSYLAVSASASPASAFYISGTYTAADIV